MATKKSKKTKKTARPPLKKKRTPAQMAATRKLVAANKKRQNSGKKKKAKKTPKKRTAKVSRGSQPRAKKRSRQNNGASIGKITDWTPCSAVRVGKNEEGEMTLYIKPRL